MAYPLTSSIRPRTSSPARLAGVRRWPADAAARWLLRLVLGVPLAVVGALITQHADLLTPNATLVVRAAQVHWGSADLSWIGSAWPPIPIGIGALADENLTALAVIGGLVTGGLLQSLAEQLVHRRIPAWLIALALLSVAASPGLLFLATGDLAEFLGLTLLVMAMTGLLRFALFQRTEGGFQAGLQLGLATACDISGVLYALTAGAAAPLLARLRGRGERGFGRATSMVLAFPALAAVGCWAFLEWRFTGGAFAVLKGSAFAFPGGIGRSLVTALQGLGHALLLCPVYVLGVLWMALRSGRAALGYLLPLPGLVISLWLGFRPPTGLSLILLTCLGVLAMPYRPGRLMQAVIAVLFVGQWVLTVTLGRGMVPAVQQWWAAAFG